MSKRWPENLWIVRHGQSAGNVARDAADAAGLELIDIAVRDMDVPLSDLGHEQAEALGRWFAALPEDQRPTTVLSSTYLRARQAAQHVADAGGFEAEICSDERLREKEFGILDRLTRAGIAERFPEQAEARERAGKFYHRPPGGESWCDVILRLRSVLDTLSLHHSEPGSPVLIVAHQVIVLCLRYLSPAACLECHVHSLGSPEELFARMRHHARVARDLWHHSRSGGSASLHSRDYPRRGCRVNPA